VKAGFEPDAVPFGKNVRSFYISVQTKRHLSEVLWPAVGSTFCGSVCREMQNML